MDTRGCIFWSGGSGDFAVPVGDNVKEVVLSKRLSESPSCIVVDENDPSLQMERMMKAMGQNFGGSVKPILEINGDHPLVQSVKNSEDKQFIEDVSFVLLASALLSIVSLILDLF